MWRNPRTRSGRSISLGLPILLLSTTWFPPRIARPNVDLAADIWFLSEDYRDYTDAVAGVGDVNGDGYIDIVIGSEDSAEAFNHAGKVYLFFGRTFWFHDYSLGDADASFLGEAYNDAAGRDVAGVGDVNRDGYDDFLVSAPGNDEGGVGAGQIYLYLGKPDGWPTGEFLGLADATFHGETGGLNAIAGGGDVDGDGFDDFLAGASGSSEGGSVAGQAYLVLGRPGDWQRDVPISEADASFWGEYPEDYLGSKLALAGDTNGDGLDDIILGAIGSDEGGDRAGQAYLVLGRTSGWASDTPIHMADASFIGENEGDWAGYSVGGAGDVNGDGLDDLVIGAWRNSEWLDDGGQVYLVFGRAQGLSMYTSLGDADASFFGVAEDDGFGFRATGAGDINGDGFDDVLASAHGPEDTYVILGRQAGWAMDTPLGMVGGFYNSGCGIGALGDVNQDGLSDFATTMPDYKYDSWVSFVFGAPCWDVDWDGLDSCSGDCNDFAPQAFPGAPEVCDGLDDDCDGEIPADEADADGDGRLICQGDCDDDEAAVYPGADEVCDGLDNDCDPGTDELADSDGDGFSICDGDCNDQNAAIYPGAPEGCDGWDSDCDGTTPEDEFDVDLDGFAVCDGDCDDEEPDAHPGGVEEPYNGIDEDCDGELLWDVDGDGYNGYWQMGDCDDEDPSVNPGAEEVCDDGIDNDCDDLTDGNDDDCASEDDDSADDDSADDDSTEDDDAADDDVTEPRGDDCHCRSQVAPGASRSMAMGLLALAFLRRRGRTYR